MRRAKPTTRRERRRRFRRGRGGVWLAPGLRQYWFDVLSSPAAGTVYFQSNEVELCWQPAEAGNLDYRVRITGAQRLTSPWLDSTCWHLGDLLSSDGTYSWQVRVRNGDSLVSPWSEPKKFDLLVDQTAPEIEVLSPRSSVILTDSVKIEVQSRDSQSGLAQIQVLAWFDERQRVAGTQADD